MRLTGRGRGASATIVVLGSAALVTIIALIFLVPLAGSVGTSCRRCPTSSPTCAASGELDALGDTGAAENMSSGRGPSSARRSPTISALLGFAGSAFSIGLALFTVLFLCLFLLIDVAET